ncbi:MAG: flippase-like domain-containing protein, partial [Myxococcales bacterium]|nr:flippase-like domain-containing protein [Myxococcales bacterium]
QHLTASLAPIGLNAHFRAICVGFALNNLLPFRAGELARCVYLAREGAVRAPTLMGTVLVERLFDFAGLGFLAAVFLGLRGVSVLGIEASRAATLLPAFLLLPAAALALLPRLTPARVERLAGPGTRLLGKRIGHSLLSFLRDVAAGSGVLRTRGALLPICLLTIACWLSSVPPMWAAIQGLDVVLPLAPEGAALFDASAALTVWVAAGVALPAAPGFVGPYHAACWLALKAYGVPKGTAVAVGTLAHGVFWIGTTLPGLVALWLRGDRLDSSLGEAGQSE